MTTRELRGQQCQCSACGRVFRSCSGFDRHRVGSYSPKQPSEGRRCLTDAELNKRGLYASGEGLWRMPRVFPAVEVAK